MGKWTLTNFYDNIGHHESKAALKNFSQIPSLLNCVQFDINSIINTNNFISIDFNNIHSKTNIPFEVYLHELVDKVLKANFSVYYNVLYESTNVCTVHIIIPEGENLLNILKGTVPIFNKRISAHLMQQDCNDKKLV